MGRLLLLAVWLLGTPVWGGEALASEEANARLSEDPRLQKTVTLQLPSALLEEVAQALGEQTGVPFSVAPALSEEKATVLVKAKPAWQVLEKLTALLELRCERQGEGYYLSPDLAALQRERAALEWERQALRREAEKMLREWAQFAREDYLSLVNRQRAVEEELKRLEQEKPPGWQDRRAAVAQQNASLSQLRLHSYLAGWLYRHLSPATWQRFWQGHILWFSTEREPGTLPLPPEVWRWCSLQDPNVQTVRFGMRYDPLQARLWFYLRTQPVHYPEAAEMSVSEEEIRYIPWAEMPLHARWSRWATPDEILEQDPRLRQRLPRPTARATTTPTTMADWLQRFAQYTGWQVVADSFRVPVPPREGGETLLDWLRESPIRNEGYLRLEGDWLLFRRWRYWRLKSSELPERLVRALEHNGQSEGLTIEDYATLAAFLTPDGMVRLQGRDYAVAFDLSPLQSAAPALRFWASLTEAQKQLALQRQPLPYVSLTPAQQQLFREAMMAKLYEQPHLLLLAALDAPEGQAELAFVIDRWREGAFTLQGEGVAITAESAEELEQQRHLVPNAFSQPQVETAQQLTLFFGLDAQRSVQYPLTIRTKSSNFSREQQEKR